jgi:hypothetical protein
VASHFLGRIVVQITRIPKNNGTFRTIYAPSDEEKKAYNKLMPELLEKAYEVCDMSIVHGFMPGRSPVTNALAHRNRAYTLCMDLKDFFDTVTWRNLQGLLDEDLIEEVLYDGAARQGLPTSPIVSNICASTMDSKLRDLIPPDVIYTRYADDLSFSFDDKNHMKVLTDIIPVVVTNNRFKINAKKTRLQWEGAGRRIITGVAVERDKIYPTRKVKRKYRAACHQGHKGSMHGLREWMRQKPPALYREQLKEEYDKLKELLILFNGHNLPLEHDYGKAARAIYLE